MNNLIELKNISKIYYSIKKNIILKKINYKFKKGLIYSLVGPSGSGKSTLLNLLSLIDKPTNGNVIINNKEINYKDQSKNDKIRADKIGIVYQQNNLLTDFTALENVFIARLTIEKNEKKAILDSKKIIQKVGLLHRLNHFPSQLSGGEQQRIAISRALVNEPEIILADEPTGSLDHSTAKEIFNILYKLRNKSRLIIYATHNRFFANKSDCKLEIFNGNIKISNAKK
tara:strand:+ start:46 stop:729 length:684 start_codon:yes stop_codon:yes gene_type:complete